MNNREIKFRAWNKIDKTMGEPFTLIEAIGSRKINGIDTSEIIYQQFTGLLDKNGVEIYEDDIVKEFGYFATFIVKFGKYKRARFMNGDLPRDNYGFYLKGIPFKDKTGVNNTGEKSIFVENGLEVIGNIHENKELLKQKTN